MAENTASSNPVTDTGTHTGRRPSPVLLVSGLLAMIVSVFALVGVHPLGLVGDGALGWLVVAAAVIVGVLLVLAPGRSRRSPE